MASGLMLKNGQRSGGNYNNEKTISFFFFLFRAYLHIRTFSEPLITFSISRGWLQIITFPIKET